MAMRESDTKTAMRHDFGQGEIRRVDIEITLDELKVWCDLSEEFEGIAICEVA